MEAPGTCAYAPEALHLRDAENREAERLGWVLYAFLRSSASLR